jgi:hypothetical protein
VEGRLLIERQWTGDVFTEILENANENLLRDDSGKVDGTVLASCKSQVEVPSTSLWAMPASNWSRTWPWCCTSSSRLLPRKSHIPT